MYFASLGKGGRKSRLLNIVYKEFFSRKVGYKVLKWVLSSRRIKFG